MRKGEIWLRLAENYGEVLAKVSGKNPVPAVWNGVWFMESLSYVHAKFMRLCNNKSIEVFKIFGYAKYS